VSRRKSDRKRCGEDEQWPGRDVRNHVAVSGERGVDVKDEPPKQNEVTATPHFQL
jgi:hypothetical protein